MQDLCLLKEKKESLEISQNIKSASIVKLL